MHTLKNKIMNEKLDIDREAEAHGFENEPKKTTVNDFDLTVTKESIVPNFQTGINTLIEAVENGYLNPLDVFATFKKLEKMFSESKMKIEEHAFKEADMYSEKTFAKFGVTFTKREGSAKLQYSEDSEVQRLENELKSRKDLVKVATNSNEAVYDHNACQVGKVSVKIDKSSLSVKF